MTRERIRDLEAELERLRAEMRSSRDDYRHVVDNIPDYKVCILDQEGRIASWNLGAQRMTGYTEAEVKGQPYAMFFPQPEQARQVLNQVIVQGYVADEDWRLRKDGTLFWAEVSITLLQADDGTPRGFSTITRDRTERRKYEEQLRQNEARIRALLDSAAQSIVAVGLNGRIQMANPMTARMFGYEPGDLIGKPISFLIPQRFRAGHDRHLASYFSAPRSRPMGVGIELMGLRGDGAEFPVEISLSYAEAEEPLAVAFISDITQRKKSEEALRASEARATALLQSAAQAILCVGRDGRIQMANPASEQVFGYRPEELVGQPLEILIPEGARTVHGSHFAGYMDSPRTRPMGAGSELMGRRKDGREFPVEVSLSHASTGDSSLAVAFISDITQRKQAESALRDAEAQLRQSQKVQAIGQLVSGVAHDFNNILTVINGRASLMRSDESLPEDAIVQLDEIVGAGERAAALTRRLLGFARKQGSEIRTIDINQVLSGLLPLLRRVLRANIEVDVDMDENLAPIRADQIQIEQIILNLVINAQDAIPDSGRLSIRTWTDALRSSAALSIADTGTGIPREIRARVFEPFFTTKEVSKGTGLGLSTVQAIVDQLGGSIELDSEPGAGSIFSMHFPAADDEPAVMTATRPKRAGRDGSILVVEDDPGVRLYVQSALAQSGYQVRAASDGLLALEAAIESQPFDLLLADLVLPGISGQKLAQRLRDYHPALKVLFMSGYSESMVRDPLTGAHFLAKPFNVETLLEKVQQVLAE